jgi:hypothetical protein
MAAVEQQLGQMVQEHLEGLVVEEDQIVLLLLGEQQLHQDKVMLAEMEFLLVVQLVVVVVVPVVQELLGVLGDTVVLVYNFHQHSKIQYLQ